MAARATRPAGGRRAAAPTPARGTASDPARGGRTARTTEARPVEAPGLDLRPLPAAFFRRPTLEVARDLLGRLLVRRVGGALIGGWIVEVEAYVGEEDPACHAAVGRTERNAVMYGPAGHAYVYFTYGMHHCVNVVTGARGAPEAVLIRALEPALGQDRMRRRRGAGVAERELARGPGRLCQALGVDRRLNGVSLLGRAPAAAGGADGAGAGAPLFLARGRPGPRILGVSSRIGIRVGTEQPWRFFDAESPWVSGPARRSRGLTARRRAAGRGESR